VRLTLRDADSVADSVFSRDSDTDVVMGGVCVRGSVSVRGGVGVRAPVSVLGGCSVSVCVAVGAADLDGVLLIVGVRRVRDGVNDPKDLDGDGDTE